MAKVRRVSRHAGNRIRLAGPRLLMLLICEATASPRLQPTLCPHVRQRRRCTASFTVKFKPRRAGLSCP